MSASVRTTSLSRSDDAASSRCRISSRLSTCSSSFGMLGSWAVAPVASPSRSHQCRKTLIWRRCERTDAGARPESSRSVLTRSSGGESLFRLTRLD